jgi:hypothetical protein
MIDILIEMGGLANYFLPRLASNHNSPISTSRVAGIIDMNHHGQPSLHLFLNQASIP